MKILRVKKLPIYDIFLGEGWYNWTRVMHDVKNSRLKMVAGENLGSFTKIEVERKLKEMINA